MYGSGQASRTKIINWHDFSRIWRDYRGNWRDFLQIWRDYRRIWRDSLLTNRKKTAFNRSLSIYYALISKAIVSVGVTSVTRSISAPSAANLPWKFT